MGTPSFVQNFVQRKVEGWVKEVLKLSKFAETQPHSAYAMEQLFAADDTEAMILVDATNAFKLLNRQVNCDKICPAMAYIIINTYRNN